MSRTSRISLAFLVLSLALSAYGTDIRGAKDHPLLTRFTGASIRAYTAPRFEDAQLPDKPVTGDDTPLMKVEGVVTRIGYRVDSSKSVLEIAGNYRQALAQGHFQMAFDCQGDACGDAFARVMGNSGKVIPTEFPASFENAKQHAMLARRDGADGTTWAFVYVMDDSNANKVNYIYQEIVEPKPMATGQVKVLDAKSLHDALARDGKVAIYGVYFDTDKATLKPDSTPELEQMAALLKAYPDLKVYIVGHTDNQGSFAHNEQLAQHRAEAVLKALADRYRISASRMSPRSVASLAPVASNTSENGRARNRRVELVVQ